MRRCSRCLLPETLETITFDVSGLCNICNSVCNSKPKINWQHRLQKLDELVGKLPKGKLYDLLIPFSGGKDSTYQLYFMRKRYPHLKILTVTFDHLFFRKGIQDNNIKSLTALGVDRVTFSPNWHIVRRLMSQSFHDKGDFCWHCHCGIYSYPFHVAYQLGIPLMLWNADGEGNSYFRYDELPEVDEQMVNRFINLGISADDMFIRLGGENAGVDYRDLWPYRFPTKEQYKDKKVMSLSLSHFVPWDWKEIYSLIATELDWNPDTVENLPDAYSYTKIECWMQGVRDYIKWIKRGYSRPSQMVAVDLRADLIQNEEAKKIISSWEGIEPFALNLLLEYLNMSKDDFYSICKKHCISPWSFRKDYIKGSALPLKDSNSWTKYPGLTDDEKQFSEDISTYR